MTLSEPFPTATPSPLFMPSPDVSGDRKTLVTDTGDLGSVVTKQQVTNENNNDAKKTEKKTEEDGDDPFGALDWKDGIATLPGNMSYRYNENRSN